MGAEQEAKVQEEGTKLGEEEEGRAEQRVQERGEGEARD
jgi:hypothetical protein